MILAIMGVSSEKIVGISIEAAGSCWAGPRDRRSSGKHKCFILDPDQQQFFLKNGSSKRQRRSIIGNGCVSSILGSKRSEIYPDSVNISGHNEDASIVRGPLLGGLQAPRLIWGGIGAGRGPQQIPQQSGLVKESKPPSAIVSGCRAVLRIRLGCEMSTALSD
ncbi:hypothetical protein P175DRAFT_0531227 [Aspergillus ochraceoroseus IBT 24754]|uniref:Uncharacterized protein n=1 Tax=Aspergillus ochraceoroseus IBT 24754 TaxID=1392256 RepID=A0A2T5LZJ6_9EURO|nr:uncharacterized protein P175DRAFT_0531227 [Aspergillus ochraceoroseus IBT 24754]PTU21707.1 hypothetical protein P175DRAFT_0531227 [Aspergillus ochraceoroseus IBT 24754]